MLNKKISQSSNIFGTDGIRTVVGEAPLTLVELPRCGNAIALWAQEKYGKSPKILIASDTRISADFIKASLKSGLLIHPLQLHDGGILPSPAVCHIIHNDLSFDCGVIISASHNPYQDNGIKIIDARSGKISLEDELCISRLYFKQIITTHYNTFGTDTAYPEAENIYIKNITTRFNQAFLKGKRIAIDCAHGAAYKIAPFIFEYFGATVISIHTKPNGININQECGALHTQSLQDIVISHGADAGFAFDGDADRVIVINRDGTTKDGDDILALLIDHPLYKATPGIVGTVMSNQGFELFLKNQNKILYRTPVGDKYVSKKIMEQNLLLGGEQSGHIIASDYLQTGDGIFIALRLLETLIENNNWDMTTFTKFPQLIINVPILSKKNLMLYPFAQYITAIQTQLKQGRLIVRYSGTELLLRIMIETLDIDYAQVLGNQLADQLQKELS